MASQRASITKELLRESLESVLKPFKIHSLDGGKFSCVLEFLMGRKVYICKSTNWFWDAISGVKYQTLLSRPFSQGAMWRVCIIRLHYTTTPHYLIVVSSNVGFTPDKSLGAYGPRDLSGVKPPFSVFVPYLHFHCNLGIYHMNH